MFGGTDREAVSDPETGVRLPTLLFGVEGFPQGEVEQVFCPSKDGAGIAFADLTLPSPVFVDVSQQQVETLNPLVAAMIR